MLVILPLHQKISARRVPFVTVFMSFIMIAFYTLIQVDDIAARESAKNYYFTEKLSEIEFPLFIRFMRKNMAIESYFSIVTKLSANKVTQEELYWLMLSDPFFQMELKKKNLIPETEFRFEKWVQLRRKYESISSFDHVNSWGFKTVEPSLLKAWVSQFLHGSLIHFLSNLLLFVYVGINLEIMIGSFFYIVSTLIIQFIAITFYSFAQPFSMIPLVGMSGVVSGLMGFHAILLGFKKIDHFVNILFYVNIIKMPAVVVLGVWVGWECIDYALNPNSMKAYSAHIGGLIGGFLMGILYKSRKVRLVEVKKVNNDFKGFQLRYDEAIQAMIELNYPLAKKIFFDLLSVQKNNQDIMFQLFNVTKIHPASEDYHKVVFLILSLRDNSRACVSMMNIVFNNYIKRAEPSIRFDPHIFLGLHQKFRKFGYLDDSEKILKILVQFNKSGVMDEVLAFEQLQLAKCYINKNEMLKGKFCLEWCSDIYPDTASSKEARALYSHTT